MHWTFKCYYSIDFRHSKISSSVIIICLDSDYNLILDFNLNKANYVREVYLGKSFHG